MNDNMIVLFYLKIKVVDSQDQFIYMPEINVISSTTGEKIKREF